MNTISGTNIVHFNVPTACPASCCFHPCTVQAYMGQRQEQCCHCGRYQYINLAPPGHGRFYPQPLKWPIPVAPVIPYPGITYPWITYTPNTVSPGAITTGAITTTTIQADSIKGGNHWYTAGQGVNTGAELKNPGL